MCGGRPEERYVSLCERWVGSKPDFWLNVSSCAVFTEEVKGEKDAGKEIKAPKEEAPKGNGKPPAERPRFMFNIADGGFTGQYWLVIYKHSCCVRISHKKPEENVRKSELIGHVISETVSSIYCVCIPVYQTIECIIQK